MAEPVEKRTNKALAADPTVVTGAGSDTPGGTTPDIEDTSFERIEALRVSRAAEQSDTESRAEHSEQLAAARAAGTEDTSYEHMEALRAARGAGEDTSYNRVEELRAARAAGSEDTSYNRIEELRAERAAEAANAADPDVDISGTGMHHQ